MTLFFQRQNSLLSSIFQPVKLIILYFFVPKQEFTNIYYLTYIKTYIQLIINTLPILGIKKLI